MNVKILQGGRLKDVSDFDIKPMTSGEFLEGIFKRRGMSTEQFRKLSGLTTKEVNGLLNNQIELVRPVTSKIDRALPGVSRILTGMDASFEFHRRYGCLPPTSPIKRAMVIARRKFALG